jgi:hypothetical protein
MGPGAAADSIGQQMERLGASADRIAQLREELDAETSRRDELIIAIRDRGTSWRAIATRARLSISRCVAVVTGGF